MHVRMKNETRFIKEQEKTQKALCAYDDGNENASRYKILSSDAAHYDAIIKEEWEAFIKNEGGNAYES